MKERVERSLYERANGHSYDAVKIFMPAGSKQPVVVHYTEHLSARRRRCFYLVEEPAGHVHRRFGGRQPASFYASASSGQSAAVKFEIDPALSRYGAVDGDARWERPQISVCWLDNPGVHARTRMGPRCSCSNLGSCLKCQVLGLAKLHSSRR